MNIDERFEFAQWRAAKEQEDAKKREAFSRAVSESLRRKTGTGGNMPTPLLQKLSAGTATPEQRQAAISQPTGLERTAATVSGAAKNFAGGFVGALDTTSRSPVLNPTLYLARKYNDLFFPNATEKAADYLMESGSADIARAKEGLGAGGKLAVDVGVGATQLLGDAAIAAATGGGSVVPMAIRSFGSSAYDARQEGGSLNDQVLYGGLSAGTAALVGKLSNVGGVLTKTYGKGALDDVLQSGMSRAIGKLIKNGVVSDRVVTALSAGIGEGVEETIEAALSPIFQKITFDRGADLKERYSAEAIAGMFYNGFVSFIVGTLAGGAGRGEGNIDRANSANRQPRANSIREALEARLQETQKQAIDKPSDGLYNGDAANFMPDSSSKGTRSNGKYIGSVNDLTSAEKIAVNDLVAQGKIVERIPRDPKAIDSTPDFYVNGVMTELKTLENANTNTGMKRIQKGFRQGADIVILDARRSALTKSQANEIINRAAGKYPSKQLPGKIEIWTRDGVVTHP